VALDGAPIVTTAEVAGWTDSAAMRCASGDAAAIAL
jgi:hypothetical protein